MINVGVIMDDKKLGWKDKRKKNSILRLSSLLIYQFEQIMKRSQWVGGEIIIIRENLPIATIRKIKYTDIKTL